MKRVSFVRIGLPSKAEVMPRIYFTGNLKPLTPIQTIRALGILIPEMREKFGTKLQIKQKSIIMNIIGFIMFFNKGFMDSFITVLGKTIYFPKNWELIIKLCEDHIASGAPDEEFPIEHTPEARRLLGVLFHEYVHQNDGAKNKLFPYLYVYPVSFSIIGAAAVVASYWNMYYMPLAAFLIYLLPTPAYWRSYYEARGYATNVVSRNLLYGVPIDKINHLVYLKYFTGPSYYWMAGHPLYNKIISKILRRPYVNGVEAMVKEKLHRALMTLEDRDATTCDELEHVYRIVKQAQGSE